MFKKLKDKIAIAEEVVKQSPQRIQQIAQAAQAAVSSTPFSANTEVTSSDQFFSITEEDTPQNSPHRTAGAAQKGSEASPAPQATLRPTTSNGVSPSGYSGSGSVQAPRQRRLSNSSMASDVSFRLPAYDSPAVYHLQSDVDCSASEYEYDMGQSPALDNISKEQLHSAYKKALDRYHKYRDRYTEVAKRYRDLERDNHKARSVLVETQDKALRRISELREQCSLEQQAKAHLESALRLEMEEMQCVVGTLKTKLTLMGENPDSVLNPKDSVDDAAKASAVSMPLLDLSDPKQEESPTGQENKVSEEKIKSLEKIIDLYKTQIADEQQKHEDRNRDVQSLEIRVKQLTDNLNESMEKIKGLQVREEENTILLAENKMVVHSELEAKDDEVKKLRDRIQQLEALQAQFEAENKKLQTRVSGLGSQINELESNKHDKEAKFNELEASKIKLKEEVSRLEGQLSVVAQERDVLAQKVEESSVGLDQLSEKADELRSKTDCIEKMETELLELKTQLKLKDQELVEQTSKVNLMEKENHQLKESLTKSDKEVQNLKVQLDDNSNKTIELENEKEKLSKQIEELEKIQLELNADKTDKSKELELLSTEVQVLRDSIGRLKEDNQKLVEEVKMTKVINENSESEAIQSLQATMNRNIEEWEARLKVKEDQIVDLHKTIKEGGVNSEALNSELEKLRKSAEGQDREMTSFKEKVERLKNEKRGLEKTLEKEIRDKNELQTQVTNILQEIGRLEEQMNELKDSHAALEVEKSQLVEQLENIQRDALNATAEQKTILEGQLMELEDRLNQVQCENTQLSERSCLVQEQLDRLEIARVETEAHHKNEKNALNEELKNLKKEAELTQSQQLVHFEDKIKELDSKLRECLEENTSLLIEKERIEQELRTLEDQNELKEKEKLCVLDNNSSLEREIDTAKREIGGLNETIKDLERRLGTTSEMSSGLEAQLATITQTMDESAARLKAAEEARTAAELEIEKLEKQIVEIEYRHKRSHEEATKSSAELEGRLRDVDNIKVENEYLNTHVKQLESDLQKLRDDTLQRESMFRELKEKYNFAENEMSSLQEQKSKFDCLMADKNDELDGANVQLATVRQELESLRVTHKTQLNNVAEEVQELKSEVSAKQIIISDLNQDLGRQERDLAQTRANQKEGEELKRENEALQLKFQNLEKQLNSKLAVLEEKHGDLIAENHALKEASGTRRAEELAEAAREKDELEERLKKIISEVEEVSNRNLFLEQKCENFLVLEQANERMKLANEKLSRQLDDTLVSLHHNEGIAANTEFEYLKNIMFQYLSGTMSGNASTLVKVISAVLKFTPQQTQVVLEKEHQRHTLLGSINQML